MNTIRKQDYELDVNKYSIHDLETLFKLKRNNYNYEYINLRKIRLYETLISDSKDEKYIDEVYIFLEKASNLLLQFITNENEKNNTSNVKNKKTSINDNNYFKSENKNKDLNIQYYPDINYDRDNNELIKRPTKEFTTVMQNEYNSGNLNPLHTPVITKCLNIDTRFRDDPYILSSNSNFTFTLPNNIKKVVSMQLTSYELPVTFYGISSSYGNNFVNIGCYYSNSSTNYDLSYSSIDIVVPDGNYVATDLISAINLLLRPVSVDGSLVHSLATSPFSVAIFNCVQLSLDISTDFNSGTGKVTISSTDCPGFSYAASIKSLYLDFSKDISGNKDSINVSSKIGFNLGFLKTIYKGSPSYVSDTIPEPVSIRYIFIVVNDFNNCVNNHFIGAFNKSIINNNILARIPITGQQFNLLMDNDLSQHLEPRKYFGPVDINRLQIQLLDDHGRILDINNANYSLCLTFKTLYDQ